MNQEIVSPSNQAQPPRLLDIGDPPLKALTAPLLQETSWPCLTGHRL